MRKQAFFQAAEENEWKFEALRGMQSHEGDLRALIISIGVADECSVVEKLVERLAAILGIHGGVHQFADILNPRIRLGRVFIFEKLDITSSIDNELKNFGNIGWTSR